MYRLIKFHWNCGRSGDLDGMFVTDDDDWDLLQWVIEARHRINFGEVLGKHSEICGTLDAGDLEVVSDDQEFLTKFVEILEVGHVSGHNPLGIVKSTIKWDCGGDLELFKSGEY